MTVRPHSIAATAFLLWVQVGLGVVPFAVNAVTVDWTAINAVDGSGTASGVHIAVLVLAATLTVAVLVVPIILLRRASRWATLAIVLTAAWGCVGFFTVADVVVYLSALVGIATVVLVVLPSSRNYLRASRQRVLVARQERNTFSRRLPRIR
jgi:type III secretory pathway component EscU